jgi:hypothetical protein
MTSSFTGLIACRYWVRRSKLNVMTRTNRFVGGVGYGYANLVLVTLAGLWLTPFFLNRIGQHDYGLWLVATQVLAYLMLLDFSLVALLPRETPYVTGRTGGVEGAEELPNIIGQTACLVLCQIPVIVLVAIMIWLVIPAEWGALGEPLDWIMLACMAAQAHCILGVTVDQVKEAVVSLLSEQVRPAHLAAGVEACRPVPS